jgi:ketosteroid isomerase-like protein
MLTNLRLKTIAVRCAAFVALALSFVTLATPSMAGQGNPQGTTTDRSTADGEAKETILKMEQDRVEYLKVGGSVIADWIDRVYVDDVVCMGSGGGGACTKAEIMAEHRSGERKLRAVNHHDYAVHVHGNTAVLTFRGDNTMERKGKTFTVSVQTTEFWVKQDGMWRIVAHLVNPVRTE